MQTVVLIFPFFLFFSFLSPPSCANTREYLRRRGRRLETNSWRDQVLSLSLSLGKFILAQSFTFYIENFAAMYPSANSDTILERSTFARYPLPSPLFILENARYSVLLIESSRPRIFISFLARCVCRWNPMGQGKPIFQKAREEFREGRN